MVKIRTATCLVIPIVLLFALDGTNSSAMNLSKPQSQDPRTCNSEPTNNCNCQCNVFQDSRISDAVEALAAKLVQLTELVNKTYTKTSPPSPPQVDPVSSCKELYDRDNSSRSQVYELSFGSEKIPVFCHMGDFGCGNGGWTMAMKIDGTKGTFHFDSNLWKDKYSLNPKGGQTGFDSQQTKLPTYWSTPFSKICLGMNIDHQLKFIVLHKNAPSLFSLIADGNYRATSLGRNKWKSLIGPRASLQYNCNKEGFNTMGLHCPRFSKARIGIISNNQQHCLSCNSRIGFGTGGSPDNSNTCGNEAANLWSDNGQKSIKGMGYILVQ